MSSLSAEKLSPPKIFTSKPLFDSAIAIFSAAFRNSGLNLGKIISTVFTKDTAGKYSYLKKEIISNVDTIFYAAVPILKHSELKKPLLFDTQIIHRLSLPLKIGGLIFFVMITVKERTDFKDILIDEFAIYDMYSEIIRNKKPLDSPSTASGEINPLTFRGHYQMDIISMNDLTDFVKTCIKNNYG